jgi:hypothetical protein
MINIGDIVRLREPWLPYTAATSNLGLVVDHMPPYAKSMEPHGLFMIMWSNSDISYDGDGRWLPGCDANEDDWYDPYDLKVVLKSSQKVIG